MQSLIIFLFRSFVIMSLRYLWVFVTTYSVLAEIVITNLKKDISEISLSDLNTLKPKKESSFFSFADHINAASPIFTRKPPPQVFANEGSTVKLCCEADGQLVWSRSGTALASLPYFQQDGCLTIRNVNGERAGEYTCRATNQFGMSEVTSEVVYTGNVICYIRNFS